MSARPLVVLDALVLRERPTGVGRSVLEMLRALAEEDRGLDFAVLTTSPALLDFLRDRARWRLIDCHGAGGGLARKALYTQWRVPTLCRELGAGLLHTLQFMGPLRAPCATLVTVHDLTWHDYPETIEQPRLAYYRLLAPRILRRAAAILANSAATGEELAIAFPDLAERIEVTRFATPSWVWESRERVLAAAAAGAAERPYFLFVSTLEPRKNLRGLLEAYGLFLEQAQREGRSEGEIPDLHLVGPRGWKGGGLGRELDRWLARGRVKLLDYRQGDDLFERYRLARALLFPSFHEGFGFPILEAMAAELPVLTSNRGAMAEVAADCAVLTEPGDPCRMAADLAELAWNEPLRERLMRDGLQRAREWTWSRTALRTCEVYHRVLDAK